MSGVGVLMMEEDDPFCLPAAGAAMLVADAPWRRFGVVGDSLSAGIGDPWPGYASIGWADRVADLLRRVRPDLAYRNLGATRADTVRTLDTQMAAMTEFAPDLLHLPCGANDLLRREPDFDEIEANLRRLYAAAAATGAQLTTFTIGRAYVVPTFPDWSDRVLRTNAIVRTLAAAHDAVLVDMHEHPINSRSTLLSADRSHFNASGQAVLATEYARSLGALLDRAMSM